MRILHLTLKKKWFDMIVSGEKAEEYREIKGYWWMRLVQMGTTRSVNSEGELIDHPVEEWDMKMSKKWDIVRFRNGYQNGCPEIDVEWKDTVIGKGDASIGAPSNDVFIIKLGKILSIKNYNK